MKVRQGQSTDDFKTVGLCGRLKWLVTVCGLAQAGIFTTKLATKPKAQIYEKLSYEALSVSGN